MMITMIPANELINTKMKINAVTNDPRYAGDNKPNKQNDNVATIIRPSCTPDPTNTQKSIGLVFGGLKTSPWTIFQPTSSLASSITVGAANDNDDNNNESHSNCNSNANNHCIPSLY